MKIKINRKINTTAKWNTQYKKILGLQHNYYILKINIYGVSENIHSIENVYWIIKIYKSNIQGHTIPDIKMQVIYKNTMQTNKQKK